MIPAPSRTPTTTVATTYLVPVQSVRFDTAVDNVSVEVTADGVTVSGDEQEKLGQLLSLLGACERWSPNVQCDPDILYRVTYLWGLEVSGFVTAFLPNRPDRRVTKRVLLSYPYRIPVDTRT